MAEPLEIVQQARLVQMEIERHADKYGKDYVLNLYCAGLVIGSAAYMREQMGAKNAYAYFQGVADQIVASELVQGK